MRCAERILLQLVLGSYLIRIKTSPWAPMEPYEHDHNLEHILRLANKGMHSRNVGFKTEREREREREVHLRFQDRERESVCVSQSPPKQSGESTACGSRQWVTLCMTQECPFRPPHRPPPQDEEPPFDMIPESLYEVGPLRCWIEFLGRYKLKGITGAGQVGECLFQIIPFGLENRQFPPLANHIPLPLTSLHFVDTGRPQHTLMPPGSCVSSDSFDGPPAGARGRSLSGASEHTQVLEDCVERRLSQTLIGSPEAV